MEYNTKIDDNMSDNNKAQIKNNNITSDNKDNSQTNDGRIINSGALIFLTAAIIIFAIIGVDTGTESYNATGNIEYTLGSVFGSVIFWSALTYLLVFLAVSIRKKLKPQRFLIFACVLFIFGILQLANIQSQNYRKAQSQEIDQVIDRHEDSGSYQQSQLAQLSKSNYNKPPKEVPNQQQESGVELYQKGLRFMWSGEYKKAIDYFDKVERKIPHNENVLLYNMRQCYDKQWEKAIITFKHTIKIEPDNADVYYCLGRSYNILDLHDKAIEAYKQAIRINPNNADTYIVLVQRELDKSLLQLKDSLAFGKEVFLGITKL